MIFEYALEPTVLFKWAGSSRDFTEFLREYGIGSPRIISSFPKKKKSKLRSFLLKSINPDEQTLQGRRYTEMVTKLVDELAFRNSVIEEENAWEDNVISENARIPFGAVVSSKALATERNITPISMYEPNSVWHSKRQLNISRTNEGLNAAISELIRLSTQRIVFVDTYGYTPEAVSFIRYLMNSIPNRLINDAVPAISLFYKEKRGSTNSGAGSPNALHVKNKILNNMSTASSLSVYEIKEIDGQDVFHNRCVLTELGGISTGHGIGVSGQQHHTDEAYLMDPEVYYKKWAQFVENNCFEIVSQAET